MHNQLREPQPCEQNRFKNLGELLNELTEAGVKASRATSHRLKEFGYSCRQMHLTWVKEKNWINAQWSKVLVSDESKFLFNLETTKVLESGGRVEKPKLLEVQC